MLSGITIKLLCKVILPIGLHLVWKLSKDTICWWSSRNLIDWCVRRLNCSFVELVVERVSNQLVAFISSVTSPSTRIIAWFWVIAGIFLPCFFGMIISSHCKCKGSYVGRGPVILCCLSSLSNKEKNLIWWKLDPSIEFFHCWAMMPTG